MVSTSTTHDPKLAQQLVLDELFDLSLYKALRSVTQPDVHHTLDELIKVETSHLAFWQKFFNLNLDELNLGRRIKLSFMMLICRIFGSTAVHLVLEAIEVQKQNRQTSAVALGSFDGLRKPLEHQRAIG